MSKMINGQVTGEPLQQCVQVWQNQLLNAHEHICQQAQQQTHCLQVSLNGLKKEIQKYTKQSQDARGRFLEAGKNLRVSGSRTARNQADIAENQLQVSINQLEALKQQQKNIESQIKLAKFCEKQFTTLAKTVEKLQKDIQKKVFADLSTSTFQNEQIGLNFQDFQGIYTPKQQIQQRSLGYGISSRS